VIPPDPHPTPSAAFGRARGAPVLGPKPCPPPQLFSRGCAPSTNPTNPNITVSVVDSVEQRVNNSQSVRNISSQWTTVLTTTAPSSTNLLYIVRVAVGNEYDNLEFRIICNWLDFGKVQRGRASPPSDVVKPANLCICKLSTVARLHRSATCYAGRSGYWNPCVCHQFVCV